MRIFFGIAAAMGLFFFVGPVVLAGASIHIGNLTGLILSLTALFYAARGRLFPHFMTASGAGRGVRTVIAVTACLILVTAAAETAFMIRGAQNKPDHAVTAIVLGCRVKGNRPTLELIRRAEAAKTYLENNPDAVCIVSGGAGDGEEISEAECLFQLLTESGISAERILLEDRSTTTEENLAFSRQIMEERELGTEAVLITSGYHCYRAGILAGRQGITAYSCPAFTSVFYFPTAYLRELYAILYTWIRG